MSYFDHFAQQSTTLIGDWIVRRMAQRQFALMQPFLPERTRAILEIGPGMGELAELFLQAGYRNYTVVEPNAIMRERLASMGIVTKDYLVPHLFEDNNTYDAIILIDVFEHLNGAQEAQTFVAEAWRVLRPDGILCIASPDYLHWQADFFNCDYSHNNITSVRRTLQLFHNTGFRMPKCVYFSGLLTSMPATLISHLARLGLLFLRGNALDSKLYKLKLTFLRRFLIIGAKQA